MLSLRTPARTVPPTPGTALQLKVQSNLEKSLGSRFDIQIDQKMGAFQASMLEVFNSLREEFPGFAITPSEYVKHAVFQIWTQISVVSASIGTRF